MDLRQELPFRAQYAYYSEDDEEDNCNSCHLTIEKDELRFAVEQHIEYRTLIWHHYQCFFQSFRPTIQEIAHFAQLKYNDQKRIRRDIKNSLLKAFSELSDVSTDDNSNDTNDSPPKKKKKNKKRSPEENALKRQSDLLYKNLRFLDTMEDEDMIKLMKYNKIDIPMKTTSRCDRLADAMTFGRLRKCGICGRGQLVFRICGYICTGYAEEEDNKKRKWIRCQYQTMDSPERRPFKVPKQLSLKYEFLKNYKYERRDRIYIPSLVRNDQQLSPNESTSESDE